MTIKQESLLDMRYYHDQGKRTVYAVPDTPTIHEKKSRKGDVIEYSVWTQIDVTRADNWAVNGQWHYPVREFPRQTFDGKEGRDSSERYFRVAHDPKCEEIDRETYEELRAQYEEEASNRKPNF